MTPLELGILIAVSVLSSVNIIFNIMCLVKLLAFEKSTHQVQYVPIDPKFEEESQDQAQDLNKRFKEYVEEDFSDIINEQSL